jgi:hypothetical protein
MLTVAALYVDRLGPYPRLPGVDCWDEERDARLYAGPHPVVAHPPCQLWGPFAAINFKRWGGEHNRPGNDSGCFAAALSAVRKFGGVLEHPAFSRAWVAHGLIAPVRGGWISTAPGEWVAEVWQSAYGHRARKRTWLFYSGAHPPAPADWTRRDGSHQCGYHDQRGKERNKPTLGKREASETPTAFAEYLVRLARAAGEARGAA